MADKETITKEDVGKMPTDLIEEQRGVVTTGNGAALATLDPTDFGDEAGAGFEDTRMEEQSVPFLRMAQGLSPEINPGKGEYIPGLTLGSLFNTATRQIYRGDVGVEAIVCRKEYGYGLWIPRDLGGGFRGMVSPDDELVRETRARMTEKYGSSARFKMPRYKDGVWSDPPARTRDTNEAIEVIETGQLYVLYGPTLSIDTAQRAIVSFTSSALRSYTNYVDRHQSQKWPRRNGPPAPAPIYAYKWRLMDFLDKKNNNEFFNWKLDLAVQGDFLKSLYARDEPELFAAAKDFFELIKSGAVKADDSPGASASSGGGGSSGRDVDEEVPF